MNEGSLSIFAFIISIATAYGFQYLGKDKSDAAVQMNSREKATAGQIPRMEVDEAKFKAAVVDLVIPFGHDEADGNAIMLRNDLILAQAVGEVSESLYVCVRSGEHCRPPNALMYAYISSVYSRLWDEMLRLKPNMKLRCTVTSDICEDNLSTCAQLLSNVKNVDAFYSSFSSFESESALSIQNLVDLRSIQVIDVSNTDSSCLQDGMFFFDDLLSTSDIPHFATVALGGTFDRLHNGHRKLITLAAAVCSKTLVIGVSGDALLKKKADVSKIDDFASRKSEVEEFVKLIKPTLNIQLVELTDPFGPTIEDPEIEAIVVSSETLAGAANINQVRVQRGMRPLKILVTRRGESAVLSSTFLRKMNL